MADKNWKQAERRLAYQFGLDRNGGGSGRNAGRPGDTRPLSDVRCAELGLPYPWGPKITFEAKWRGINSKSKEAKRFFTYSELDKLRNDLKKTDHIPVVALFEKNRHGYVVCVHSGDLLMFAKQVLMWFAPKAKGPERIEICPWRVRCFDYPTQEEDNATLDSQ